MRSALLAMTLLSAACSFEDVDPNIPKTTVQVRKLRCGSTTEYCHSIQVLQSGLIKCNIMDQGPMYASWKTYYILPTNGCRIDTVDITVVGVPEKTSGEEAVERTSSPDGLR